MQACWSSPPLGDLLLRSVTATAEEGLEGSCQEVALQLGCLCKLAGAQEGRGVAVEPGWIQGLLQQAVLPGCLTLPPQVDLESLALLLEGLDEFKAAGRGWLQRSRWQPPNFPVAVCQVLQHSDWAEVTGLHKRALKALHSLNVSMPAAFLDEFKTLLSDLRQVARETEAQDEADLAAAMQEHMELGVPARRRTLDDVEPRRAEDIDREYHARCIASWCQEIAATLRKTQALGAELELAQRWAAALNTDRSVPSASSSWR